MATERPWERVELGDGVTPVQLMEAVSKGLVFAYASKRRLDIDPDFVAWLVQSHDALIEALRGVNAFLRGMQECGSWDAPTMQRISETVCKAIDSALASAEREG